MMEFALRETKFSMLSLISRFNRVVSGYVLLVYVIKGKSLVFDKRFSVKSWLVRGKVFYCLFEIAENFVPFATNA